MHPKTKIKEPPGLRPGRRCNGEAVEASDSTLSAASTFVPAWTIPAIYEDGAKVSIDERGRVIIAQSRLMERPCQVEFSLREAEELLGLLPTAIAAAKARRN